MTVRVGALVGWKSSNGSGVGLVVGFPAGDYVPMDAYFKQAIVLWMGKTESEYLWVKDLCVIS